jgi:hypothetical protein
MERFDESSASNGTTIVVTGQICWSPAKLHTSTISVYMQTHVCAVFVNCVSIFIRGGDVPVFLNIYSITVYVDGFILQFDWK